jgi:hypothetical protein
VSRAAASLALLIALLAAPVTAAAHVNRAAGPYAFFVLLIEEPLFETNRAGFEFWVRDGERTVEGLERTLHAIATNSTREVALRISPLNDRGFYDVETDPEGRPFDPGGGGDWTLRLTGMVEGLSVDVSFPVTFPAYPRTSTSAAAAAIEAGPDIWVLADGVLLVAALAWLGLKIRRRRPDTALPRPSA